MAAEKRETKDWRPQLGELQGGARLLKLYQLIKGKFAVKEIWTGGGGNEGIQCLQMCGDLLEQMENGDAEALGLTWAVEELRA